MMKNVLLLIPRYRTYGFDGHYVMPMGTLYVSAYLKRSGAAHVTTLNLNHHEGEECDILADVINHGNIDIIGFGGLSGEYQDLARMARYARAVNPDITLVMGGGIVTADPETAMRAIPEIDYGIIGEGERTIVGPYRQYRCPSGGRLDFPRPSRCSCQDSEPQGDRRP